MPAKTIIQLRRDTAANWTSEDPVLAAGEAGVETDTNKMKIGDGTTAWSALDYFSDLDSVDLSSKVDVVNPEFSITGLSQYTPTTGAQIWHPDFLVAGDKIVFNSFTAIVGIDTTIGNTFYLTDTTKNGVNIDNIPFSITGSTAQSIDASTVNLSDRPAVESFFMTGGNGYPQVDYYFGTMPTVNQEFSKTITSTELGYIDNVASGIQAQLDSKSPKVQVVSDKSANYTLQASDVNSLVRSTGSAITITVPEVLANGERIDFIQAGAGQITFAGSGVTINSADAKLKTAKQYAGATIFKAGGAYYLIGNLG